MKIYELMEQHDFFRNTDSGDLRLICDCAMLRDFEPGEKLAETGNASDSFYVIRKGRVSIAAKLNGHDRREIQTLGDGEVVGWSWIFPPYEWVFDVTALEPTSAICFESACVRSKCEQDPRLGYELMKRFAAILSQRLRLTRMQLSLASRRVESSVAQAVLS